jgi:hypothetical protein
MDDRRVFLAAIERTRDFYQYFYQYPVTRSD